MQVRDTIAILTCGVFSIACQEHRQASAASAVDTLALGQAREAAAALGGDLMTMLTRELARGGPVAAIAVCADSAQERTSRHQRAGVDVRRVGTRVRNPANSPDPVETAVLTAFARELTAGRMPGDTSFLESVPGGGRELRYLRPIRVQEACLACHGPSSALAPGVRALLAARYPMDRATDYAIGDLRGAISVRLTLPPPPGSHP
jgi:Protein of unknown function (DUF3365)